MLPQVWRLTNQTANKALAWEVQKAGSRLLGCLDTAASRLIATSEEPQLD